MQCLGKFRNYRLLKLKDWPDDTLAIILLPRRTLDVQKSTPFGRYTGPTGVFNLAAYLAIFMNLPDLGPKFYCAYGEIGIDGHGTTKVHVDVADAVNIMTHVSFPLMDLAKEGMRLANICFNRPKMR